MEQLDAVRQAPAAGPDGNRHTVGDGTDEPRHDLVVGRRLDVGDDGMLRHREHDLREVRQGDRRVDRQRDAAAQLLPTHLAIVRGSPAAVPGRHVVTTRGLVMAVDEMVVAGGPWDVEAEGGVGREAFVCIRPRTGMRTST